MEDALGPDAVHKISPGLIGLAVPIDSLIMLPNNYRHGDIPAIAKSYDEFGQRKPLTAQRDADGKLYITSGNHSWQAAKRLGWTHIAAEIYDEDRKKAVAWALADNRTAELGTTDEEAVASFLSEIEDDMDLLEATGYDILDFESLIGLEPEYSPDESGFTVGTDESAGIQERGEPEDSDGPIMREPGKPVIQYVLIFDDVEQQQNWYNFIKWLRRSYPSNPTIASRIDDFLNGLDMSDG